ncbi:hypothetical protein QDW14_09100 [Corynebacterium bovis]|nr:hypothetical protein [Corynebacterium bovis]
MSDTVPRDGGGGGGRSPRTALTSQESIHVTVFRTAPGGRADGRATTPTRPVAPAAASGPSRRLRGAALAAVAAVSLTLAACGGDDSSGDAQTSAAGSAAAAPSDGAAAPAATRTEDPEVAGLALEAADAPDGYSFLGDPLAALGDQAGQATPLAEEMMKQLDVSPPQCADLITRGLNAITQAGSMSKVSTRVYVQNPESPADGQVTVSVEPLTSGAPTPQEVRDACPTVSAKGKLSEVDYTLDANVDWGTTDIEGATDVVTNHIVGEFSLADQKVPYTQDVVTGVVGDKRFSVIGVGADVAAVQDLARKQAAKMAAGR